MSSASFLQYRQKQKQGRYYIVRDDFIANLRKDNSRAGQSRQQTEGRQPSTLEASSLLIQKKKEVLSKMRWHANNDFYQLQKQIDNNKKTLYRRLTASLRKNNMDGNFKISNPFLTPQKGLSKSAQKFDKDRNLLELIVQVQPYWIKKYVGRSTQLLQ